MSLLPWSLTFLKPYRMRVAWLSVLLLAEIGLGALQPWPLAIVIDYVLQQRPIPEPYAGWLLAIHGGDRLLLLIVVVVGGVLLQLVNQFVSAYGTQVQVDTGQRMVYDLRGRLFEHLTGLGLHHHIKTSTADAVYRVDVDAYAIENLVMSGIFPLATSFSALAVMFVILVRLDLTIALLSLTVVPFMYLCLRYYMSTLVNREQRVKELESKLLERLYETFGAMRLVKSFAREPHELGRYTKAGETTMNARIAITWQQSMFSVVVGTITVLGTALVVIVGGSFVMRGRLTVGQLTVVIAYLAAVYGPLSAIAHTTGNLQGAVAGARRVREMFAMTPETVDAPGAVDAGDIRGDVVFEGVGFTYPDGTQVLHDIDFAAKPGEMIALVGLTGAGKTTLVSLIPRFYDATAGRVLVDGSGRAAVPRPLAARQDRDRPPGAGAVFGDHRRQHPLRPARRHRRADRGGGARRARPRVHCAAAEGVRHRSGRGRRRVVGRRAATPQRRPRDPEERADPHPRRADILARRDFRRDRVRGAAPFARRPDDDRDRPPAVHRARRRPDPRPRRRPHRGAGPARGAADEQPALSPHVRSPLGRQVPRRARDGRRADQEAVEDDVRGDRQGGRRQDVVV